MEAAHAERSTVRVIGRYALCHEIGYGGMATVHLGRLLGPVGFSRTIAIKRLHPHLARDPELTASFLDEARLAARIRHPNVVSTLDVVAADGEVFLVMEYVQGESLARLRRTLVERDQMMPPAIACGITADVLRGLHAAHEATNERGEPLNIVHRDVSPQNVLVATDGVARLLDFGIAKAIGRLQTTRDGQIKGKLAYMAPEQLGGTVDRRTDVYATAVVLWETLTSRRLFKGDFDAELYGKLIERKIDPPSTHAPGIPRALDRVVMRGLALDPVDRYPTAREMVVELERAHACASPTEIGAWVEEVARETLEQRAHTLAEVENISSANDLTHSASSEPVRVARDQDQVTLTDSAVSRDAVVVKRRGRRLLAALLLITIPILAAAVLWAGNNMRPDIETAAPVASATDSAPLPSASGTAAPITPRTSTSLPAASSSPVSARSSAPVAPRPPNPKRSKPAGCTPPYEIDSAGRKKWKIECL